MAATILPTEDEALSKGPSPFERMPLNEVLDDLLVRFILNLPAKELTSMERIYFQCEQAHWFYEDFVRPLNPSLQGMKLRNFSFQLLQASRDILPLIQKYLSANRGDLSTSFDSFMKYKHRVPVCGAILLNKSWDKALLVKGWKSPTWTFPKGKINQNEAELACAVREVHEETGYDCGPILEKISHQEKNNYIEIRLKDGHIVRLYIAPGVDDSFPFKTLTRKEISEIGWVPLSQLPSGKNANAAREEKAGGQKFYHVAPFVPLLRKWIGANRSVHPMRPFEGESGAADPVQDPSSLVGPAEVGTAAHAEAPGPVSGAGTEQLKALLGLGTAPSTPAQVPQTPSSLRTAELIAKHGDARSHEFLSLMREDQQAQQPATGNAPMPAPLWTKEQAEQAKRQAQGNALLAQLLGPAPAATPPPVPAPPQSQPHLGNGQNVGWPVGPSAAPVAMAAPDSHAPPHSVLGMSNPSIAPQARSLLDILGPSTASPASSPSPALGPTHVPPHGYPHAAPAPAAAPSSQSQALLNLISPIPAHVPPPSVVPSFPYANQAQQYQTPPPAQQQAAPGAQQQHALLGLLGPQGPNAQAAPGAPGPAQPPGATVGAFGNGRPSVVSPQHPSVPAGQEASLLGLLNGARPWW